MRKNCVGGTSLGRSRVAGPLLLVCGLWASMGIGLFAADSWKDEIERDWLRQEAARQQRTVAGVTTHADAIGGVDGVKNGQWGFHTSQDAKPWWQVDLGEISALERVLVYNACHVPDRTARLKVLLSADGQSWREVYAHDGTVFRGTPDNKPLAVPLRGEPARFLRIELPGPTWLHLDEVEVYGQADPAKNLALHRPADQSSVSEWSKAKIQTPVDIVCPVELILERGRNLLADRRGQGIDVTPLARVLDEVAAKLKSLPAQADANAQRDLYLQARWAVRNLMLADPRLEISQLLFVKRTTYHSSHIYTDHFDGSSKMGGNLCILSPLTPEGKVTEIAPELTGGLFGRFDLSHDAHKIVFAYKKPNTGYRIYEIGIDGTGLRQLTLDAPDEQEMLKQFHHGYDDMDPCYLPNGRIMFVSTRSKRAVLCHNAFTSTALHLMDADGANIRCLSGNTTNEFAPCVLDDGRVIYTRWEYVDKGCGDVQSLWTMRPDGSGPAHLYKNNVALPSTLIDARSIPGSHRLVAIGAPHMPLAVGPVILVDIHLTQLTPAAMTNLTPEIGLPPHSGYPGAQYGYYKEPYPLGEDLFLVCYNPSPNHAEPAGYGIYVLDAAGNRELLYRDPTFSSFQPIPLRPRRNPANLSPVRPALTESQPAPAENMAALFMTDVYQGLTGIARGTVKYLRVMEDIPKPWAASWASPGQGDGLGLQNPAISLKGHFTTKQVLGLVPVNDDGSAHFQVPAGKSIYFQVLDENYMELQRMRTFVNLMSGEQRSCIGCHESRQHAPGLRAAGLLALNQPAQSLMPQPGESRPRMVHYPLDVQPILDKHCVQCHGGTDLKGNLDLTGELTTLFNRSYENLINRRLINNIDVDPRSAYIPAEPPLTFGSHRSKMIDRIRSGQCPVQLSQAEFIRLVTWIDANAPYYGVYEGKKNLRWKDDPEFRPNPR
ncbi:MAG: discoidin domain-containing protein [Planctomycetota bacterium]|nr:discoidin domain-containing protein [Planctomycetota bacterium]